MASADVEKYLNELKGTKESKEMGLYSLKKELDILNNSSKVFDNLEKESMHIDKDALEQIEDFSLLLKIRKLSSEIKNKKTINDNLHTLHFSLNLLKNVDTGDIKQVKNIFNLFLYNNDTKIDNIVNELNDFKHKINQIKKHHENLLPKSLDNKLRLENKYDKHIKLLHSIHAKQKTAFISLVKLFLKFTKKHLKNLQKFKKQDEKHDK